MRNSTFGWASFPMVVYAAVNGMIAVNLFSPTAAFSSVTTTTPSTRRLARAHPRSKPGSETALWVSQSNEGNDKRTAREGENESVEEFQRRMAVVRSLQMTFYGKDASKEGTPVGGGHREEGSPGTSVDDGSRCGPPELDLSTGKVLKLPLFRAAWYELPGRSNILMIRDPRYTNMFEKIFYTRNNNLSGSSSSSSNNNTTDSNITPWIFGHLYTPKEKETDQKSPKKNRGGRRTKVLSGWNVTDRNSGTTASALSSPAVLGTLMYIRDFRRLQDGRILALVQAAEKFVVEDVRQSLPYAIADVRILPDVEELGLEDAFGSGTDPSGTESMGTKSDRFSSPTLPSSVYSCDENDKDERFLVNCLRANEGTVCDQRRRATSESIHVYHHYECDPLQRLDGIPQKSDLGILDITHDAISKALPYCRFSNTTESLAKTKEGMKQEMPSLSEATPSPSLEFQLLRRGISKIPPSDRRFSYNTEPTYSSDDEELTSSRPWTTEELEYELWLVLDYFLAATNKPISSALLALLPSEDQMPKAWPSDFRLKDMALPSPFLATTISSGLYPNHRRQRRFSYSAAYLLESINRQEGEYIENSRTGVAPPSSDHTGTFEVDEVQELRALLLSIPSTRQRLRVVLESFHRWRLYQECNEFA